MTTRDQVHGSTSTDLRAGRAATDRGDGPAGGPTVPERLAAAREQKGVDLSRAERETKIRARYLGALERGDYRALPGTVYTKGFLRNYAIYLGLDPEDIVRQWRRERGEQSTPAPLVVPAQPIEAPPRPLTFSPSIIVAALMTVGVIAFGVYLGVQLLRYARPPDLAVTNPAQAVLQLDDSTTNYQLEGTSSAGATVEITASGLTEPYRTTVQSDGTWSVLVDLRRGRNEFDITAKNPDTGKITDTPRTIVITVPFLVTLAPTLTISQPSDGTTYQNGAIPVEGTTTNAKSVTVSVTYLGAPGTSGGASPSPAPSQHPGASPRPGGSPTPSHAPSSSPAPGAPSPTTVDVNADGSFTSPLQLTAGRWAITVTATADGGQTASLTRTVTVAYSGVNLVIQVKGGNAWIKVWVDGAVAPGLSSGRTYHDGDTITFTGKTSIEVRTGSSGSTDFILNGVSLGALGKTGIPETWLFAPPNKPVQTNRH